MGNTLRFLREEAEVKNSSINLEKLGKGAKGDQWEHEEIPDDERIQMRMPEQIYSFKSHKHLV